MAIISIAIIGRIYAGASSIPAINVVDEDGNALVLNPAQRPVLYFAWWCEHCNKVLRHVAMLPPDKQPVLVSTYLKDDYVKKTVAKLKENGLTLNVYYDAGNYPEIVPLLVTGKGQIKSPEQIIKALKG